MSSPGRFFRTTAKAALATLFFVCAEVPCASAIENSEALTSEQMESAVADGIARNLRSFRLGPGDAVELLFHFSGDPETEQYLISVGDELEVDFAYHPELNRGFNVRPDGHITLPRVGEINASGMTTEALARTISERVKDFLKNPVVTVDVKKFRLRSQEVRDVFDVYQKGMSKRALISPDGNVFLPLLPPIMANGKSLEQLNREVNDLYQQTYRNLKVSMMLDNLAGKRVFVFGEVRTPGAVAMNGPVTILQAIAQAGGPLESGSLDEIKLVYPDLAGQAQVRTVSLADLEKKGSVAEDQFLPPNATIYLPPTTLTKLGRGIDQVIHRIFLFNGFGVGFNYDIRRQTYP